MQALGFNTCTLCQLTRTAVPTRDDWAGGWIHYGRMQIIGLAEIVCSAGLAAVVPGLQATDSG
ncbi:hypothetical protein N7475_005753 [Penicillium sp. IBT 31633x]|nr:hypothetical protein N7475_005753 [Penicillium sp. IBT 31633x]